MICKWYKSSFANLKQPISLRFKVECCVSSNNCRWWPKENLFSSNAGHYLTRLRPARCRGTKIAPKPKFTSATCHRWGSVMQTIIAHTEFLGLLALNIPSHLISFSTLVINSFPSFSCSPMDFELHNLAVSRVPWFKALSLEESDWLFD